MSIFITGGTGFVGGYVCDYLLKNSHESLVLVTRARSQAEGQQKIWSALQLHMSPDEFCAYLPRIQFAFGDLTEPMLGLDDKQLQNLPSVESVIHIAASLNRRSERECLNHNLRGTLHLIELVKHLQSRHPVRKFTHVSTVAVAGQRSNEIVLEDQAIDWNRQDYDPYGRTKKFCEYMIQHSLTNMDKLFVRPSIVMGDSRFAETSQFDMVRAFCWLADLPWVPLDPHCRLDIVNADFVGSSIAKLHLKDSTKHSIYHLSSGEHSLTIGQVAKALEPALEKPVRFAPAMSPFVGGSCRLLAGLPRTKVKTLQSVQRLASLLHVFWPYITFNTVFDNQRVCQELDQAPVPYDRYCGPLYRYAKSVNFRYPYAPLPKRCHPNSKAA